ncbi:MAG TPA: alpha/beta fold hydrolase [Candidatus Thermoplasmatota archaeon]|nr:alpha/beta fold hydrolase [Candidatus Thermoplasmatota archaeon]
MDEAVRRILVPGGVHLSGRLHVPKRDAAAGVVVAHPHPLEGGDMENPVVRAVAEEAASRGLATLRFDFRHVRGRAGLDEATLVADSEADLLAAVENLRTALPPGAPVALVGYSFGGVTALRVAAKAEAAAVGVVGLPVVRSLAPFLPTGAMVPATVPVLVMQGVLDELGAPEAVTAWAKGAGVAVEVRPVPGAAHGYYGKAEFVGKILGGFLTRRLAPSSGPGSHAG